MALYARLSNHVFDTFSDFQEWMTTQQFDFIANPDRTPILKKGQKVFIKETGIVYGVVEDILNIEDVLNKGSRGELLPNLKPTQNYIFRLFSPAVPSMELFTMVNPGVVNFKLGQTLVTQNATVKLDFVSDLESINRTSYLTITNNGNVKINTGQFIVDCWTGESNVQYREDSEFSPMPNSTYAFIVKSAELVYMIEIGRTSFALEQEIPDIPSNASKDKGPSVQAVSKSLAEIRNYLDSAVKEASGFLVYCGINPVSNTVERVREGEYILDIMYAVNTEKEIPTATKENSYALVLNDQTSVKVFKSEIISEAIFMNNSLYLGEGKYGNADEAPANLQAKYTSPITGVIVSNLDTETEWMFNGVGWVDTRVPCGDSEYVHASNYLGVYIPDLPYVQALALNMIFPLAKRGNIAYNTVSNTEWEKGSVGWFDTDRKIGETPTVIPNPIIAGKFSWNPTNDDQVRALLNFRFGDSLKTGDIVYVEDSNEWMYDKASNSWTNTGNKEGSSLRIPNPKYISTGNFGNEEDAANNLMLAFQGIATTNDYVGNIDSDTDWRFDGQGWVNTNEKIGTYSTLPNPSYIGDINFDKYDNAENKAVVDAAFPSSFNGAVLYNLESETEWTYSNQDGWTNTFRVNYSTPEEIPNANIIGTYTYLEYWTPPSRNLQLLYPNAKPGNYVYNLSTGTIWKYNQETLTWADTKEQYGEVPEDDPMYLGQDNYNTNPPTDEFLLLEVFPKAKDNYFAWNLNSDTYWRMIGRKWIDTNGKTLIRFLYKQEGKYGWNEVGTSPISSGNLFHLLSRDQEASKSETYWFANTWNIIDFETITVPQFSNDNTGTITGSLGWGYIEAVVDEAGNSYGRVVGLSNKGDGSKFLTDAGTYEYVDSLNKVEFDVDLYLNQENGNDENTGYTSEQAWKTPFKFAQWLRSNLLSFRYDPRGKEYPMRVTLHIEGNAPDKDLMIDGIPYLNIVGDNDKDNKPCKNLHLTNSSVTVKDVSCGNRIIVWKSKLKTSSEIACLGIKLVDSKWEQEDNSNITFEPTDQTNAPVIQVDSDSTMYHTSNITTFADLYSYVPFLEIKGRYVKGPLGAFISDVVPRPGAKFVFEPTSEIIGTDIQWLTDNVPYEYLNSIDTYTPHVFPSVQTMYGDENQSGFKVGNGEDIIDIVKRIKEKSNIVFPTMAEAEAYPESRRYVGMVFYVEQLGKFYYFKEGISNNNIQEFIAPVYIISQILDPHCEYYDWLNVFPFGKVDMQGFLIDTDTPVIPHPAESIDGNIAVFDTANGGVFRDSGMKVAEVAEAVSQKHTHSNKAILDELGQDENDQLTFKGEKVNKDLLETIVIKKGDEVPGDLKNNGVIFELQPDKE